MSKTNKNIIVIFLSVILLGAASWAFYKIINTGAGDLLTMWGVTNIYLQSFIVIVVVIGLLLIVGFKGKDIIKKILRTN